MLYTQSVDPFLAQDILDNRKASLSAAKLAAALELMSLGIKMKHVTLVREHPGASEAKIRQMLTAWLISED
jgi:hypothetical protein